MYDLVLKGGLVVDGTGAAPYTANICIRSGRIDAITPEPVTASEVLDVSGLAVTPGFIDIHSHSDAALFAFPHPENSLRQGVTTQITGNCGSSTFPSTQERSAVHEAYCRGKRSHPGFLTVTDLATAIDTQGVGCNYGMLAGHSNLRITAIGPEDREPDPQELQLMKDVLERELLRGCFGMSLGLIYPPSSFASTRELTELARVIAKHDGILAVHMRNEGPRIFQALEEMLEVTRRSGVRLQISHLKLMGKPQWGMAPKLTEIIENARSQGLDITCDQYPFPASSTSMTALVPRWAHNGGKDAMLARIAARESTIREDIAREMDNRGGPGAVMICRAAKHPQYVGKYIGDLADKMGVGPAEAVCRVLTDTAGGCSCIYFCINEADIHHIMRRSWVCPGSDSSARNYSGSEHVHPRAFATFSQYFQTVREQGLLPLQETVRKATGLPASILRLSDRGTLEKGKWADIAVFDPNGFSSRSTFLTPNVPPVGMYHVLVNGQFVVKDQTLTNALPGKPLLKL